MEVISARLEERHKTLSESEPIRHIPGVAHTTFDMIPSIPNKTWHKTNKHESTHLNLKLLRSGAHYSKSSDRVLFVVYFCDIFFRNIKKTVCYMEGYIDLDFCFPRWRNIESNFMISFEYGYYSLNENSEVVF